MKKHVTPSWRRTVVCLICLFGAFCVMPVWADDVSVSHKINRTSTPIGGEVLVTLSIDGLDAGGIVEIIPEGFSFLNTAHPEDKYQINGQKLVFSVIGEHEITYQARAESAGSWTFTGTWNDIMDKTEGTIQPITVTAGDVTPDSATPSSTSSGVGSLVGITLILASIGAGAYIVKKKR